MQLALPRAAIVRANLSGPGPGRGGLGGGNQQQPSAEGICGDRKARSHFPHKDAVGVVPELDLIALTHNRLPEVGPWVGASGYERSENDICGTLSEANA